MSTETDAKIRELEAQSAEYEAMINEMREKRMKLSHEIALLHNARQDEENEAAKLAADGEAQTIEAAAVGMGSDTAPLS